MSDFVVLDEDNERASDEKLSHFMGITGLDRDSAQRWLQIGNMDVETTIELFLSNQSSTTAGEGRNIHFSF